MSTKQIIDIIHKLEFILDELKANYEKQTGKNYNDSKVETGFYAKYLR